MSALAILSWRQWGEAEQQRQEAERERQRADQATASFVNRMISVLRVGPPDRESLDASIARNPLDIGSYFLRGLTSLTRQDYASAIKHFSQMIEINPKLAAGYILLGNVYFDMR